VQQVVREISDVQTSPSRYKKKKAVFFADDNLIADMGFARELIFARLRGSLLAPGARARPVGLGRRRCDRVFQSAQ